MPCEPLNTNERRSILEQLRTIWPPTDGHGWHPLDACLASPALHVETAWFAAQVSVDTLRARLAEAGDRVVWQLFEGSPQWEDQPPADVRDCAWNTLDAPLAIGASEAIWLPRSFQWLIYTDHEEGTYFVGQSLIEIVEQLWPDWVAHQWSHPGYVRPQWS